MTAARITPKRFGALLGVAGSVFFSGLMGLMLLAPARAEPVLHPFTAGYTLKREGINLGEATYTLRPAEKGTYLYESTTQASGILAWFIKDRIEEYSKWTYHGTQIRPLEYSSRRVGGKSDKRSTMRFDWEHNILIGDSNGRAWRLPLPPDVSDKLVYQLAIMRDLQTGKKPLQYTIADDGNLKDYKFEVLGEEALATELGRLHTIKIRRVNDKRNTTVWCAPKLRYLPVRLDQTEKDGSELSMQIRSVKDSPDSGAR